MFLCEDWTWEETRHERGVGECSGEFSRTCDARNTFFWEDTNKLVWRTFQEYPKDTVRRPSYMLQETIGGRQKFWWTLNVPEYWMKRTCVYREAARSISTLAEAAVATENGSGTIGVG